MRSSHRLLSRATLAARSQRRSTVLDASSIRWTATSSTVSTETSTAANSNHHLRSALIALTSLSIGFGLGRSFQEEPQAYHGTLPSGTPRACCEDDSEQQKQNDALLQQLEHIVGSANVLHDKDQYLKGTRLGHGPALCIVTPRHLHEVQPIVQAIVNANAVVVVQGRNTGLTGGSVPRSSMSRPTVLLSMTNLQRAFPIDNGKRIVCLAGMGLASLQQFLDRYFPDRESHSTLGSTFLNPTTAAGVAFGSGGTQCRKGPVYTERALYLKVTENKWHEKQVQVVNTLDVEGFTDDEVPITTRARKVMDTIAYKLDTWSRWTYEGVERDMKYSVKRTTKQASDTEYAERLCQCNSSDVSRYNADTRGPDCCRSEGKVIVLATVHDTFPKPKFTKSYWLSFDSLDTALKFRKDVCLNNPKDMPVSCEYMDRDSFDVIDRSGRVLSTVIATVGGTSLWVGKMWNVKLWIESLPFSFAPTIIDHVLHGVNNWIPSVLPADVIQAGKQYDHHIAMTVGEFGNGTSNRLLARMEQFQNTHGPEKIHVIECTQQAGALSAFRFAAAPAFRTWCVGEGAQGFSVDYALPKNGGQPPMMKDEVQPVKRMRYSHFGCNVVHEDVALPHTNSKTGQPIDAERVKHMLKAAIETQCHGKLPAEHGHGTEYQAPEATQARWKRMDPLNVMNPGIGGLPTGPKYNV